MTNLIKILIFCVTLSFINEAYTKDFLKEAISNENRKVENIKRDKYRNPEETLLFFGIKQNMKVIELQPSGGNSPGGWYTEILAPYLKENGLLIAAHFNPKESDWRARMRRGFEERVKYSNDFNKINQFGKNFLFTRKKWFKW